MHRNTPAIILASLFALSAFADSGGPYVGVPDAASTEKGPVFQIPRSEKPLRHFITHMPRLTQPKGAAEPDSFDWEPITGHHASISSLGHVGGHHILCVRYTSDRRLEQGLDYADAILILARNHDTGPNASLCVPVFFSTGGPSIYNHTARVMESEQQFGAICVTGFIEGTGASGDETFIRYSEGRFLRYTPDPKKPAR